jgi:hypothetical protein
VLIDSVVGLLDQDGVSVLDPGVLNTLRWDLIVLDLLEISTQSLQDKGAIVSRVDHSSVVAEFLDNEDLAIILRVGFSVEGLVGGSEALEGDVSVDDLKAKLISHKLLVEVLDHFEVI